MEQQKPSGQMTVRFWGVSGSVPVGMTNERLEQKMLGLLDTVATRNDINLRRMSQENRKLWMRANVPFAIRSTHGGNTACVEVRCDDTLLILDMGTGLRELGISLMPQIMRDKGLRGYIFQSHVHWDHIQGLPFFGPLFMPRRHFDCKMKFFGGKAWDAKLEDVLAGQMNPPLFPVNLGELRHTGMVLEFDTVFDDWTTEIPGEAGPIKIVARKLSHPQETFGYRITYAGKTVTFTTDHEPYAAGLPKPLLELVSNADLWITDCQYSHDGYIGKEDGVQKFGWGHSFPAYIADVAREAMPKSVITTHHDPRSSDEKIMVLAEQVGDRCKIGTQAAYEGLVRII